MKREIEPRFGDALRTLRRVRGVPQEAFDQVSSRTYVSSLERGIKQPTLKKLASLAAVLDIHPATLAVLSFAPGASALELQRVLERVSRELAQIAAGERP